MNAFSVYSLRQHGAGGAVQLWHVLSLKEVEQVALHRGRAI